MEAVLLFLVRGHQVASVRESNGLEVVDAIGGGEVLWQSSRDRICQVDFGTFLD